MHEFATLRSLCGGFVALATLACTLEVAADDGKHDAAQIDFFEKKIRPVLADKCYKCHSEKAEKIKGGLVLDTREGIRGGGDNGPAVVPGNLKESLLIEAIRYATKDTAMPPEKSGGKLPDAVIADFEGWVKMGAPDPRDGAAKVVRKYDTEEAKRWWAFQAPAKPAIPVVGERAWGKADLDKFILARFETKGVKPVGDADKLTLLRRVTFDLVGLPPTTKEIEAFLKETAPDAFAKLVDRLLASPQFGERWGRHWLDVARFAESSGKETNIALPHAWRYRDYVVAAFNGDKPYDQFIGEQIAGDLLPAKDDKQRAEQLIATGFLAIGPKSLNERNPRQFCLDLADEQIDAMSQAILGMTIACARCHDHKFDPIPQRDYYALAGIFLSTATKYGTAQGIQNRHASELIELPRGAGLPILAKNVSPADRQRMEGQLAELRKEQRTILQERFGRRRESDAAPAPPPRDQRDNRRALQLAAQIGQLEATLKSLDESGQAKPLAMGVQDLPVTRSGEGGFGFARMARARLGQPGARPPEFSTIADSALYGRGEADKPADKVPRGFPAILSPPGTIKRPGGSGRLELAEWLTSPGNPLTSRVIVNRVWHWLFGRGIVESVDNFGTSGQKPSNQALLDYLAIHFQESGWSIKKLVREIVLSRSYQLSSEFDERNFAVDPENTLIWRMSKRRLDAECVRDAMLAVSGELDLIPPVGSLIASAGDGPIGGPRLRGISEESIIGATGKHRSLYLPIARDVLPDGLAVFDFAEPSLVTGARETTNVPSQALYMLNSAFAAAQAQKAADRILAAYPGGPNGGVAANLDQRLAYAYWIMFCRPPSESERQAASAFFTKFPSNWSKNDHSAPGLKDAAAIKATWTSFCRALFASAEFRYLN
jgi:hypothetical protein